MAGISFSVCAVVLLMSVCAGVVQTVTGFGAGIVLISVLPAFFGVTAGAAVNTSVSLALSAVLAYQYRKHVNFPLILPLTVPFVITSSLSIYLVSGIDTKRLGIAFGFFLLALSLFFLIFSEKITLPKAWPFAVLYGLLSGVFSGLFSVGGPLIALYLLETSGDRDRYIANTQMLFFIIDAVNMLNRCITGLYTVSLIPFTLAGLAGILAGKRLGLSVAGKITPAVLKKAAYVFVGIAGLLTIRKYILM